MTTVARKHYPEIAQCLKRYGAQQSAEGLLIKGADIVAQGFYIHGVNGKDWQIDPNRVTDEGLYHLLNVAFTSEAKQPNWHIALFSNAVTPLASWTAANFASTASEVTSATDGYVEATRQAWTIATPAELRADNFANKARFTFATSDPATPVIVEGAALLSESAKGSTDGVLMSATRFAAPRSIYQNETLDVGYGITLAG